MTKQGKDQDPSGEYIRKWVPELSMVPTKFIHEPWKMPIQLQNEISCLIGRTYPSPILDELESRKEGVSRSYARGGRKRDRLARRSYNFMVAEEDLGKGGARTSKVSSRSCSRKGHHRLPENRMTSSLRVP